MEQQTAIARKSLPDPFDDNNLNSDVRTNVDFIDIRSWRSSRH